MDEPIKLENYKVSLKHVEFDTKYCNMVVNHMVLGKSYASFGAIINVSLKRLNAWREDYPEFDEAVQIAELKALDNWEEIAMGQANGDIKGSPATLSFVMKNRFGDLYKEKQEIEHNGGIVFQIDSGIKRPAPIEESIDAEYEELL